MTDRLTQWFTISPLGTTSGPATAKYKGGDSIGEGEVGRTYNVTIISSTKLAAPYPPFKTGETSRGTAKKESKSKPRKTTKKSVKKAVAKKALKKAVAKKALKKAAVRKVAKKAAKKAVARKVAKKAVARKVAKKAIKRAAVKKVVKKVAPKKKKHDRK